MEVEEPVKEQPKRPETPIGQPQQATSQSNCRQRHGYAAVEISDGTARIIRWETKDTRETTPEQVENQRRLFRLGKWLSKQPISDQARAEYFDIERVSPT